jgi:hypothetical protein
LGKCLCALSWQPGRAHANFSVSATLCESGELEHRHLPRLTLEEKKPLLLDASHAIRRGMRAQQLEVLTVIDSRCGTGFARGGPTLRPGPLQVFATSTILEAQYRCRRGEPAVKRYEFLSTQYIYHLFPPSSSCTSMLLFASFDLVGLG